MFNKLFANCILVDDFDKSFSFYKNTLGLKVDSQEGKFANFKVKGASLAIFQKDEATSMFPKEHMKAGGGVILGFLVDNVADACEKLTTKGVEIFEGPKITDWGQTVAYFKDPDGNILEISEPFE